MAVLLFLALLAPSAWFAWHNREMPQLGQKHDDAIYYIVSKSLAEHGTYRIESLRGEPFETKYPPVVPALLTIAWLAGGPFPGNLKTAVALEWFAIPLFLGLAIAWYGRVGLTQPERWCAAALLAASPYTVAFGAGIFTEVWFGVFLLASLLACERSRSADRGTWWALAGGLFAGVAYLTRTAGIAALLSGPAAFLLWRKRREAVAFCAGMLPLVAGWMGWVHLHRVRATDLISLYNTDYLGFQLRNVAWDDLPLVVWTNFGYLLNGIAALPFPLQFDSMLWQALLKVIAVATITGLVRCRRNRALWPYLLFGALACLIQLAWVFPPDLRFLYSLAPLFAVGLISEGRRLAGMIRRSLASVRLSDRVAAGGLGAASTLLALGGIAMQLYMDFHTLPKGAAEEKVLLGERLDVYRWFSGNVAMGDAVLSVNPALYLYTGSKTAALVTMPIHWYRQDVNQMIAPLRTIDAFALDHGFRYVCLRSTEGPDGQDARKYAAQRPGLREVYRHGYTSVFRVGSF